MLIPNLLLVILLTQRFAIPFFGSQISLTLFVIYFFMFYLFIKKELILNKIALLILSVLFIMLSITTILNNFYFQKISLNSFMLFYSDVFSGCDWVRMRDCVCSRSCASVGLTGESALSVWLSCGVAVLPVVF